jgi:hypothetical protein
MVPNLWPETKYGDTTEPRAHQFVYEFDFADRWTHLCTAAPTRIDPATNWESFRAVRCRVGGGKRSPTKTGAAGQTTTKNTTSHPTRAATSHLCSP